MYTYGYATVTTYDEFDMIISHLNFNTYTQAVDYVEEHEIKEGNLYNEEVLIKSVIVERH
jgi:hypothetical protein